MHRDYNSPVWKWNRVNILVFVEHAFIKSCMDVYMLTASVCPVVQALNKFPAFIRRQFAPVKMISFKVQYSFLLSTYSARQRLYCKYKGGRGGRQGQFCSDSND